MPSISSSQYHSFSQNASVIHTGNCPTVGEDLHFGVVKSSFSAFLLEPELPEYYQIIVIPVTMRVFRERAVIKESVNKFINSVIIAFYGCLWIESVVDLVTMMLPVQMKRIIPNAHDTKSDPVCGE
ncbi:hypothetical protein [Acetobacter persici]|uniref:Uncharacterized protein n=1 Tax=Acetobacter persici TaxID=1076596 RepID=A0A6V8I7X2_9PROT|nr:hypothetical protein [Acetobacter persici]OUI90011.1 hypothetical protein HK19_12940 [Acetobacter persici]GFE93660.1 hypothetical protein DmAi_17190 [Acetobacter persici]